MSSSRIEDEPGPLAVSARVTDEWLTVDLQDGRSITVPLVWFPRLVHASASERSGWRLIGRGEGIHWPQVDEDISVEALLAGRPSAESRRSFDNWLATRGKPPQRSL
jgi:hypothetical protein